MREFDRYLKEHLDKDVALANKVALENAARALLGKAEWNSWSKRFSAYIAENPSKSFEISFSKQEFNSDVSFDRFQFPCVVTFRNTRFFGNASFIEARFDGHAHFVLTEFGMDALFDSAEFYGQADFRVVKCKRDVGFSNASFNYLFRFNESSVKGDIMLGGAKFLDTASFSNSCFSDMAYFSYINFDKRATFFKSRFGSRAVFRNSVFNGPTNFNQAVFDGQTDFQSSVFNSIFSLEESIFLNNVPDFNFAVFVQPPYISNTNIPNINRLDSRGNSLVERYRKLKKMSIQSNDHESELKYFGYEMHAKFYSPKTIWHRKVFIKLYYWLSNFGNSVSRPVISLVLFLSFMFSLNYLLIQPNSTECIDASSTFIHNTAAFTLSEAVPLIKLEAAQKEILMACLFGGEPLRLLHSIWSLVHFLPATLMLFLFGLGVRNRFKIK